MSKENTNQAAANKAAEEGGLPAGWKVVAVSQEFDELMHYLDRQNSNGGLSSDLEETWEAFDYDPTDRASRQVANKAQHDRWGPNGEFAEFYVAGFEGREICPTTKGNALAAYSNGIKDRVANKAEVDLSSLQLWHHNGYDLSMHEDPCGEFVKLDDVKALLATPPATTGASTVLTDDQIMDMAEPFHDVGGVKFDEVAFARHMLGLREVAAQAGQVAVPEGFTIVPLEPTDAMMDAPEVKVGGCYSCSPEQVGWHDCAEIYRLMVAAAPSPAKESK